MNSFSDKMAAQDAQRARLADDEPQQPFRHNQTFGVLSSRPDWATVQELRPDDYSHDTFVHVTGMEFSPPKQAAPSPDYSIDAPIPFAPTGKKTAVQESNDLTWALRENSCLKSDNERLRADLRRLADNLNDMAKRLGQEHAENETRKAALQSIVDLCHWHGASNSKGEFTGPR